MIAGGKETKEHEGSKLLSKHRIFSCLFLLVTGPASPSFCWRGFCDFGGASGSRGRVGGWELASGSPISKPCIGTYSPADGTRSRCLATRVQSSPALPCSPCPGLAVRIVGLRFGQAVFWCIFESHPAPLPAVFSYKVALKDGKGILNS